MTAFEQTVKCRMIMVGISSISQLADRTGICRATIFNRFKHPQGCLAYEMESLSNILGISMGELAETCRKRK